MLAQILKRLLADAPTDTVFVGHSLDLAVKLIEASTVRCLQVAAELSRQRQETKNVPCATVVLQPWMLRSKQTCALRLRSSSSRC